MSIKRLPPCGATISSITFSAVTKGLSSSSPIDLTAMRIISSSEMPTERSCLRRKYFPASISVRRGTSPTISVPVTLTPRAAAARQTSSNATCRGVVAISVIFIDTCAMPYSSINHPIALVPLSVPGTITCFPFSSRTGLSVTDGPWRIGRPFSRTSNAIALALRVEVVLRLKFTAIRKSRAPTTVAPLRAISSSNGRRPKSGASPSLSARSANASYSPFRQTARFLRSGRKAAAS